MNVINFLFLLFFLIFNTFPINSHSYENCGPNPGNSCWLAKNKSSLESVNIHCKDINDSVFQAKLDKNKQEYTYQFCSGWADGMGYPGPGVKTQCKITFSNGNKLEFSFPSIDWGNMVTFIIFDDKVELNLQSPWSKKRFETKVFPLK